MLEGVRSGELVCYLSELIIQTALAHVPFQTRASTLCLFFCVFVWTLLCACVYVCACLRARLCVLVMVCNVVAHHGTVMR